MKFFLSCPESNLNGAQALDPRNKNKGLFWKNWKGSYAITYTKMMIRPKKFITEEDDDEYFLEFPNEK